MATIQHILQDLQAIPFANAILVALALGALSLLFLYYIKGFIVTNFTKEKESTFSKLPHVPVVPGLPVIGNVLQLREKKPYKTFTRWAETYGPIYSTRVGACTMVILNSTHVAKEALVTRHSSISNKKLSESLMFLSFNKCMVAISDYNAFYKLIKRYVLTNVLGVNAQKRHRSHRDIMRENVSSKLHAHIKKSPEKAVDFREIFEFELFGVSLKQAFGKDVEESMYVEELGTRLSRYEMFKALVLDIEQGSVDMDWRDFFPYLRWIPNKSFEKRIQGYYSRRKAVMNALIDQQKKRIASGEVINCFIDYLLAEAKTLTIDQITMLVWETIIETTHTTSSTTEWALHHLARDPKRQDRLYEEIQNVCGSDKLKVTEEHLSQLPYLTSVFHETLRMHSPVPTLPLRYAHEDTQLGGYYIPAGTQIAINVYGCNNDKNEWESPQEWKPERFLDPNKYDAMDLYKTMAFGGGKRVCAGSLQGMLIACTSIGRLVQEFEWKLRDGEEANEDTVELITHKLNPLHAIIKPRNSSTNA